MNNSAPPQGGAFSVAIITVPEPCCFAAVLRVNARSAPVLHPKLERLTGPFLWQTGGVLPENSVRGVEGTFRTAVYVVCFICALFGNICRNFVRKIFENV